ncbi:hypothetical protein ACFL3J_01450 [Candidatus Omnitrophota bacterium]
MKKILLFLTALYFLSALSAGATHSHDHHGDKGKGKSHKSHVGGASGDIKSGSGSSKPKSVGGMDDFDKSVREEEDTFDKDFESKK